MSARTQSLFAVARRPAVTVAIGLVLSGASGSAFLAIINASFPRNTDAGNLAVLALTALNFLLGTICAGMMAGAEQEMARAVSKSIALGQDPVPVERLHARHAARLILWTLLGTCLISPFLLLRTFNGHWILFPELLLGLVGGLAIFPIRGVLTGRRDYPMFSSSLFIEGFTRLVPAVAMLLLGLKSVWLFGLVFALGGPTLASLWGVFAPRLLGRRELDLPAAPAAELAMGAPGVEVEFAGGTATSAADRMEDDQQRTGARLRLLTAATMANQLLFNAIPLLVTARYAGSRSGGGDLAMASAVGSAVGLTRIEIMMMVPMQAPLIPPLVSAAVHQRYAEVRRRSLLLGGLCAAIGVVAALACWLIGPWVMRDIMRAHGVLPGGYLAVLATGTAFMMVGFIAQSTLLALERHRTVLIAWIVGVVVTLPVFFAGHSLLLTTGIAGVVGPLAAMLIMVTDAWLHTRGGDQQNDAADAVDGALVR